MASTFTTNKGIEKPAAGSYSDTWAVPVNADWDYIDTSLGGSTTINVTGVSAPVVLTLSQYQPPNIIFTGTISANLIYLVPAGVGGLWSVFNNTSGAFTIAFGVLSSGVNVPQGQRVFVVGDGHTLTFAQTAASSGPPTALVGLTAIPGVANTFMPSDAAPALNVGISPTWTGTHRFQNAVSLLGGGFLTNTLKVNSTGIIDATSGGLECATAPAGSANEVAASTAFVAASFAPLQSPALTGGPGASVPTTPTAPNGTNTTQIASTAFAVGLLSATTIGYQKFASGLILQWGRSAGGSSPQSVSFPLNFPNACWSIVCVPSSSAIMNFATSNPSSSVSGFTITASDVNPCSWIAVGN